MDKEQKAAKRQINVADTDIELFISKLDKFLSLNLNKVLSKIVTKDQLRTAQSLNGLIQSLEALGLSDQISQVAKVYGRQLKELEGQLVESSGQSKVFNDVDIEVTQQLILLDTNVITNKIQVVTSDISSTIYRQVITGETPDIDQLVEKSVSGLASQVKTELTTATAAFSRSVNQRKAEELGLIYFLYTGPLDKITRPFCRSKVGKIFTKEEIAKWDNGQGIPANLTLGGYNCRHDLRPISEYRAKQLGYGD